LFFDVCCPGNLKALLNALMHGAIVFVKRERAVGLGTLSLGNFHAISQLHCCDSEQLIVRFNSSFDVGFQVVCCRDSARFQRAGKCAGQSTGECGNDVVNSSWERFRVFHAIILRVAPMRPKMQRLRKSLDVRFPKRPFLLYQPDFRCVNDITHRPPPSF
jgi:hypothetical protein